MNTNDFCAAPVGGVPGLDLSALTVVPDADALDQQAGELSAAGTNFRSSVSSTATGWNALVGPYQTPEQPQLLATFGPVNTWAQDLEDGNGYRQIKHLRICQVPLNALISPKNLRLGVQGESRISTLGVMVSIGNISPNRTTEFDPGLFTGSGVQIRASMRYPASVLGKSVAFIESNPQFPWEDLVDADFPIVNVIEALKAAEAREVTRAGLVIEED